MAAVQPGAAVFFLETVNHRGQIPEVNRAALECAHHQPEQLLGRTELAGHPQLIPAVAEGDGPARRILVFTGHHLLEAGNGNAVVGQFVRVDLDTDFPFQPPGDFGLQYAGDRLDIIGQVVGDFFQTGIAAGTADRKDHDGQFRNIDFKNSRIVFQIRRQLSPGVVHLVFDFGQHLVDIGAGNKLDVDLGNAFGTDRLDFFNPIQPFQFFLNGDGNRCFDIGRRHSLVAGGNKHVGNRDVRRTFAGQGQVAIGPENKDHHGQHHHADPVFDGGIGNDHRSISSIRRTWRTTWTRSPS